MGQDDVHLAGLARLRFKNNNIYGVVGILRIPSRVSRCNFLAIIWATLLVLCWGQSAMASQIENHLRDTIPSSAFDATGNKIHKFEKSNIVFSNMTLGVDTVLVDRVFNAFGQELVDRGIVQISHQQPGINDAEGVDVLIISINKETTTKDIQKLALLMRDILEGSDYFNSFFTMLDSYKSNDWLVFCGANEKAIHMCFSIVVFNGDVQRYIKNYLSALLVSMGYGGKTTFKDSVFGDAAFVTFTDLAVLKAIYSDKVKSGDSLEDLLDLFLSVEGIK